MLKAGSREVKMPWEDLAEVLRRAGLLLGYDEGICNITLAKPKQMILILERKHQGEKSHVSK